MGRRIYVVVDPGRRPGAVHKILRWAHALLPAAVLLTAPGPIPPGASEDDDVIVISVDAEEVEAGPLALADAIARGRPSAVERARDPHDLV